MRTVIAAVTTLTALGCGISSDADVQDGGSRAQPSSIRDSLGVTILEYQSLEGADTSSWRIDLADSVRIGLPGLTDGPTEYHIGMTRGAVRLPDGRIAVADALAHTLRIFEPDGSFSESVGRRGEGPGEIDALRGLVRFGGDSLLVLDRQAKWTLLDGLGRFVRSGRLDMAYWPGITYPAIMDPFADGSLLVAHSPHSESSQLEWGVQQISTARYYRAHRSGAVLAEFGTFPGGTNFMAEGQAFNLPYRWVSFSPGGRPLALAMGNRFYWSDEGLWEVRIFTADAILERIIRMDREALESQATPPLGGSAEPNLRPSVKQLFEEVRSAVGVGPFKTFVVDELGNIWFREQIDRDGDPEIPARWYVFDPDGLLQHVVRLPYNWQSLSIGADYVLALDRDEFGVDTYMFTPLIRN